MKTILFVCTGNICRSPMAEGLFRHATQGRTDCRAISAGVGAMEGQPPSPHAVRALKELDIDISQQRSRMLTPDLVEQADYIFGMTHSHVDSVNLLFPHAAEKTFLLREFDETLDEFEKDITDPIGGSYETYAYCRDQIEQGIFSMLKFHRADLRAAGVARFPPPKPRCAVGCDHAGFRLKEAIKEYLQEKGISLTDVGANSSEVCDYTDYARAVGELVAAERCEFGLLICSTGIGMSMAANKIAGVRAALVFDEHMAALSRQHNNANVLCLGASQHFPGAGPKNPGRLSRPRNLKAAATNDASIKWKHPTTPAYLRLKTVDPEVANAIFLERQRQQENIELIASENFVSPAVMEAQGSVLDQ